MTKDTAPFRSELRTWLLDYAPKSLYGTRRGPLEGYSGGHKGPPAAPDVLLWCLMMAERGLTAPTWPAMYGGGGLSTEQGAILDEELARLRLPPPLVGFGPTTLGATLLELGSARQKAEHLPPICRGDVRWCEGSYEANSGSERASLATVAVRDGHDFVVRGEKIWSLSADISDWMFCLVGTSYGAKKAEGMTCLLIDMATSGIGVRKMRLISGPSAFCEVSFSDVRVPENQVVLGVGAGRDVFAALRRHERLIFGFSGGQMRDDAEASLVALAREVYGAGKGALSAAVLRDAIAGVGMEAMCLALTSMRLRQEMDTAGDVVDDSAVLKVVGSELTQRRWELAMRILGPEGVGWQGDAFAPAELQTCRDWLRSQGATIEDGTSEAHLSAIAQRLLGP